MLADRKQISDLPESRQRRKTMSLKEELLKRMSDGVVDMEEDDVAEAAQEFIDAGYPRWRGLWKGSSMDEPYQRPV